MNQTKIFKTAERLDAVHHLVTPQSRGKPLCGESSSDAAIGSYVEHIDDAKREFVAEVFGKGGRPVPSCQACLALYPTVLVIGRDDRELRRVTPFVVRVNVAFTPSSLFGGYDLSASGLAEIGACRVVIGVDPQLTFTTARWFHSLHFNLAVDAPLAVPLVNKANKDA